MCLRVCVYVDVSTRPWLHDCVCVYVGASTSCVNASVSTGSCRHLRAHISLRNFSYLQGHNEPSLIGQLRLRSEQSAHVSRTAPPRVGPGGNPDGLRVPWYVLNLTAVGLPVRVERFQGHMRPVVATIRAAEQSNAGHVAL